ncbi:putative mitochondrial chaperone bcs1 [Bisporella sp. PMI_857]|nr:putative mitochondrial chaperone bcs1 [Bisporella sp. PMI_857]
MPPLLGSLFYVSLLDFLFPSFTRISTATQWYLSIDLSVYTPLICFFGLLVFACGRICRYLFGLLETYCTSTIHLRYREDAYHILMLWISSQSFAQKARSSLVTTDLACIMNASGNDSSNGGDVNKKTYYYTLWNGRFLMWYKGRPLVFRRENRAGDFSCREEVSISCFSRSPKILRQLLSECCTEYGQLLQGKTCLYKDQGDNWIRSAVSNIRRSSTWYFDRGIPYQRGYLLYGPPGTGKSSFSCAIAGELNLDIYILSLSAINEANLKSLFNKLPSRCVILLEDIDAVSSNRDAETEDIRQIVGGSPLRKKKPASGNVSLSALLNVIDGIGSQDGRILVMTTNFITHLHKALIRPGRIDIKVEFGLADKKMAADIFRLIFKPLEAGLGKEAEVEQQFAVKVPELKFSPAEIQSFLLVNKRSPCLAVANVDQWITTGASESATSTRVVAISWPLAETQATQVINSRLPS